MPLLPRLRICLDQLRLADRQGGRLNFNHNCSVAVIEGHQPKLLSRVTSNMRLRHIDAQIFVVLVNTLYVGDTSPAVTYMFCAIGQCAVLGFPCRTSTSLPTKLTCGGRGHPDIREAKVKYQPPFNCQPPRHGRGSPPAARRSPSADICQPPRA